MIQQKLLSNSIPNLLAQPRRFYMAGLGRFTTRVREQEWIAGENPYGYANGNPVTWIDPGGLWATTTGQKPCKQNTTIINPGQSDMGSIVVGQPKPGTKNGTLLDALDAWRLLPIKYKVGRDCILINGPLFGRPKPGYIEGVPSSPIHDIVDCEGRKYPGYNPGGVAGIPFTIHGQRHGQAHAFTEITSGMSPGLSVGRVGVCIKDGKAISFVIQANPPGATAGEFGECMKSACPPGSKIGYLDGGGSTQVVEVTSGGKPTAIVGNLGQRPVLSWIIICGIKEKR